MGSYGNGLHCVQLSILTHAPNLLSDGGLCIYSTCSFNPVENEAVICSALQRFENEQIQIVDCTKMFPKMQRRHGLTQWKVWHKSMKKEQIYSKYDDVPNQHRKQIKETMFAPNEEIAKKHNLQ